MNSSRLAAALRKYGLQPSVGAMYGWVKDIPAGIPGVVRQSPVGGALSDRHLYCQGESPFR